MKKCILICLYFGKFKKYFNIFLKSCSTNPEYDWLIITDDRTAYNYPANVHVRYIEFNEFKNIIQSKFKFEIALNRPYKLCDFKPTYGYVLEEWIKEYEYWGHCDCDLLFGDMQKILSPLLEKKYEKLFVSGHLTIYRNSFENNRRFMMPFKSEYIYEEALGSAPIYAFDEQFFEKNVNAIYVEHGASLYMEDLSFNCCTRYYNITREYCYKGKWIIQKMEPLILYWNEGEVKSITYNRIKAALEHKSYLYVHLQGRDMKVDPETESSNCIRIEPERFSASSVYPKALDEWRIQRKIYFSIKIIRLFISRMHLKANILRI
jgi:hypothetical protein